MKFVFPLTICRQLLVLTLAALVALGSAYAPIVLDNMANTTLTATALACGIPTGGC